MASLEQLQEQQADKPKSREIKRGNSYRCGDESGGAYSCDVGVEGCVGGGGEGFGKDVG